MKSYKKLLDQIDNPNVQQFLKKEIDHCVNHNIKIKFQSTKFIEVNGVDCCGYFEDMPKPFMHVAINKPLLEWLPIFIHESCHKDQYLEKTQVWSQKIRDYFDAGNILDMWLNEAVELTPKQLKEVINQIIQVELDCEKRTVEKIKTNNLPLNIEEYIQQANSYILYHHLLAQTRSYPGKACPYELKELWSQMPKTFEGNYTTISKKISKLLQKHCW
jgi:hypothetical protein